MESKKHICNKICINTFKNGMRTGRKRLIQFQRGDKHI